MIALRARGIWTDTQSVSDPVAQFFLAYNQLRLERAVDGEAVHRQPVRWNDTLSEVATVHLNDALRIGPFKTDTAGITAMSRLRAANHSFDQGVVGLFQNQGNPVDVLPKVEKYKYESISAFDPDLTEIGIAYVYHRHQHNWAFYLTKP